MKQKKQAMALLPVVIFLAVYIGAGVYYEYIRPREGVKGFYVMSVTVAFLIALLAALLQTGRISLEERMNICARGLADGNIFTMILIFLLAGAFGGVASASGCAVDTANLLLSFVPGRLTVLGIFLIACLISMAMGTSTGTITVMGTLALTISKTAGLPLPLCFGVLVGGAMFGDNLSFISDTTIAATKTQGCKMRDKFRENFFIAVPAAAVTCLILFVISMNGESAVISQYSYQPARAIPYFAVLTAALLGINVFLVLGGGLLLCGCVGLFTGSLDFHTFFTAMGDGVTGMYETILVTVLAAALAALIKYNGGFEAVISFIRRRFRGRKGGQLGIAALSALMDISTANNTVAIVVTGPIVADIRKEYGISPQRAASLMDIFTCVCQGILPYGAQLLIASGIAGVSPMLIIPYLIYPFLLLLAALTAILLEGKL